ncbi:MAG TPA: energy transducer TonB [Blastocatellia bacterium]|nr:energy transducer TonB [Blastocatellia bacterium]
MGNRKKLIAIIVSLGLHAAALAAMIAYDLFSTYRSVGELKIGDFGGQASVRIINPADYGIGRKPPLVAPPERPAPLEEVRRREKREQEAEAKERARDKAEKEAANEGDAEKPEIAKEVEPADKGSEPPKFGQLDTGPIKQHIALLWHAHEQGSLDLPSTFSITAACKVNRDGSFSDIRIVESSGSRELDRTALAILTEISNQKAFAPLSLLSSVSVRLEVGAKAAGFSLVGFAPNAEVASDMVGKYRTMLAAAKLFISNSDTREILGSASVQNDLARVRASISLPRARAAQMMAASFN